LNEQVHRWNVCEQSVIWEMALVWEREGRDSELVFGTQAQHLAARDQELDIRTSFQQLGKPRCHRDDVFKVVQEQEPLLVVLRGLEQFQQGLRAALHESQTVSDGRDDQVGIADGCEGDNVDPIREVVHQFPSDLERQARFAHTCRAGERK
jgi:hypothetical protein